MQLVLAVLMGATLLLLGSAQASSLLPPQQYPYPVQSVEQISALLHNQISQVFSNGQGAEQTNLLKNLTQYFQAQATAPDFASISRENNAEKRIALIDQWYLTQESSALGAALASFSEKNLSWRKSLRGIYVPPDSTPEVRELSVYLLLKLKPEGYQHVLARYAAFPDTESVGKHILIHELRHCWSDAGTYSIYRNILRYEANEDIRAKAQREIDLFYRKI